VTFVTLVISLIVAQIGGALGTRRLEWGMSRTHAVA
jgi:hypothetical protein